MARTPQRLDRLREAVALAHTIPGVSLELTMAVGRQRLVVSDRRLGAQLTPCQLRAAVLSAVDDTTSACFTALIEGVEVQSGVHHIGGGLYECTPSDGRHERWFATSLHPDRIIELLEGCTVADDDDELGVILKHDTALGICSVCVMSTSRGAPSALEELAAALLATTLAAELIGELPAADRS